MNKADDNATEEKEPHGLQDDFQAEHAISDWIKFYNTERPHIVFEKKTPEHAYFCQSSIKYAA